MPSLEKMRAIRKQQRARAGKVSPLEPKAKKGRSKSKRTGIRDTAKKTQEATAKKKAADAKTPKAKTPKAKTPKAKTTVKETAVKKTPTKVVGAGVGAGRLIGVASRLAGWAGLAYGALHLVDPVMKHLFPKSKPRMLTPELKASQERLSKAMEGKKQSPSQQIHGGGFPFTGQQTYPGKSLRDLKKAEEAVSPLVLTGPVKAAKTTPEVKKNKFTASGVRLPRNTGTEGIPNMDEDITRQYKKPVSRPERGDDYNYPPKKKSTTPRPLLKVSKSTLQSKQETSAPKPKPKAKAPKAAKRVTKDFDTTMGVYGWNNLTNSFGYLGTEKEVGKHGASTYFTEGYRRGSKVEGYGKKRKKKPTTIAI